MFQLNTNSFGFIDGVVDTAVVLTVRIGEVVDSNLAGERLVLVVNKRLGVSIADDCFVYEDANDEVDRV